MLYQKLHFLDKYCLESSRCFRVEGNEEDVTFKITWNNQFEASVWDIRHYQIHKKALTGDLVTTLNECGVNLKDFEKKLSLFLRAYRSHLERSLEVLAECSEECNSAPHQHQQAEELGLEHNFVSDETITIDELFEYVDTMAQESTETNLDGYDLSPLVDRLPTIAR